MAHRVGTLRCRYRAAGAAPHSASVRRLDRLATDRLGAQLESALSNLATQGEVYVVRRVHARSMLNLAAGDDGPLSYSWGRDLAGAVARAITRDIGDGANVVRFANEASFVAAFVADLLTGTAWQRWYYGAFARHRHRSPIDAIQAVLAEHRADLGAILAELAKRGMLERLLAVVDRVAPGRDEAEEHTARAGGDVEAWRPLVVAAVGLVAALGCDAAGAPSAADLATRWAAIGGAPPDWGDTGALADAVATVFDWLLRMGWARPVDTTDATRIAAVAGALDWLDGERLARGLMAGGRSGHPAPTEPRPSGPTPRQRDLLTALVRALREQRPRLEPTGGHGANALRLRAALATTEPTWGDDPLAGPIIDRLLAGWARLDAAVQPERVLSAVAAGDRAAIAAAWWGKEPPTSEDAVEGAKPGSTPAALTALAGLGEPAAAALAALAGSPRNESGAQFSSPVAGVLLLWRVVTDVRLADFASRHGYPPAGPGYLVAELGRRWAGPGATLEDRIDPAVLTMAGRDAPTTATALTDAWAAVPEATHAAWRAVVDDLATVHRVPAIGAGDALEHTAYTMVRIWARWLPGFERSSVPFLLAELVRRPGEVTVAADRVTVELDRRPLDTVLEVAGYLRPLEVIPGLLEQSVHFVLGNLR